MKIKLLRFAMTRRYDTLCNDNFLHAWFYSFCSQVTTIHI